MTSTRSNTSSAVALLGFVGVTTLAATLGALATRKSVGSHWYRALRKPWFQPPRQAFGPVWTTLYALIAASGYRVWRAPSSPARTRALALWGTQLALNGAWTWIFFGAREPKPALAELILLVQAITLYANEARKVDPLAAWLVAPYLGWTGLATALNEEIVRKNA